MEMYLVKSNVDTLAPKEFGVSESNHVIGLFSDESMANAAKEKEIEKAKLTDYEDEYSRYSTTIEVIPIEVDKIYDKQDQIFLGGGFYIE